MIHIHFVKVDHETLLIIGSLGIQLSSSYASGRESTTFIEMSKLKDIVINEAVYMVNKLTLAHDGLCYLEIMSNQNHVKNNHFFYVSTSAQHHILSVHSDQGPGRA